MQVLNGQAQRSMKLLWGIPGFNVQRWDQRMKMLS